MDEEIQRLAGGQRRPVARVRIDIEKHNGMPVMVNQTLL